MSRTQASPAVLAALDMILALDHMPQRTLVVVAQAAMMAAELAEISIRTLCPVRGEELQRGSTQPCFTTAVVSPTYVTYVSNTH